jgi:hypothetical protein
MSTPLIRRPESNGAPTSNGASNGASTSTVMAAAPSLTEYALPATARDLGVQVSAVLGLLTGLWVALSPWFITLQNTGTNATTVNLISGLAVAGLGAFVLLSPRGFAGLQVGNLVLGVWLIVAGPILAQKNPIADSMFWSNSWAGGVLIVLAAIGLAAVAMRRPVRR